MVANPETDRPDERSAADAPSVSEVFAMLSRKRRRIVLEALLDHRHMTMADLAEQVACREEETAFAELDEEEVLEVYTSLWHQHVPKLEEGGLVEYDEEHDLVALAPAADEIDGFIF